MKSRMTFRIVAGFVAVAICAVAHAQFGNGDFSLGTHWTLDGNVQYATVGAGGATVALFQEPGEGTVSGAGSRARIHQSFDLTSVPSIIFRYRLSVGNGTRDSSVPPDSFTAALYDTGSSQRIASDDAGDAPDFSDGFYYADADGKEEFDTAFVNVTGPDANGFKTVTLDLSSLAPTVTGRLEFGFASADNGVTSAVFLDDVETADCTGSSIYCCSTSPLKAVAIDDGKPCTFDECVSGVVTHDLFDCCGACDDNRPETAIMIMIDVSDTMPALELATSKNSIVELLNRFRSDPNRPYIGVTPFFEVVQAPPQSTHQDPTKDYNLVETALANIVTTTSESDLRDAINYAAGRLNDPSLFSPSPTPTAGTYNKYMLLITDGWSSLPRPNAGGGVNDDCHADCCTSLYPPAGQCGATAECMCGCTPARDAAATAADNADSSDIQIYVAHYVGDLTNSNKRYDCTNPSWRGDAIAWMEADIATTPNHIFKNTDVADQIVNCTMTTMAELINCDDLDNCTTDSCIEGLCIHTPIAGCVP